jgi:hypothetical protein
MPLELENNVRRLDLKSILNKIPIQFIKIQ